MAKTTLDEARYERDWLLQECLRRPALRCFEVAKLTQAALWAAVGFKGLARRIPLEHAGREVDYLADSDDMKTEARRLLAKARSQTDQRYAVRVMGKGGPGYAQFPISLVENIFEFVWDARRVQIGHLRKAIPNYQPPGEIFLSERTGEALRPGSVGDILANAFDFANVAGSAHRLRARGIIDYAVEQRLDGVPHANGSTDLTLGEWDLEAVREFARIRRDSDVMLLHYAQLSSIDARVKEAERKGRSTPDEQRAVMAILERMSADDLDRLRLFLSDPKRRLP